MSTKSSSHSGKCSIKNPNLTRAMYINAHHCEASKGGKSYQWGDVLYSAAAEAADHWTPISVSRQLGSLGKFALTMSL